MVSDLEFMEETEFEADTVDDSVLYTVRDNRGVPVEVLDTLEDGETEKLFFLVTVLGGEGVEERLIIPLFVTSVVFVIVLDTIGLLLLIGVNVVVLEFVVDAVLLGEDVLVLLTGPLLLLVEEAV